MKTGCGVENLQLTTLDALTPTIALLSVVAVFLMMLRDQASRRDEGDPPARTLADPDLIIWMVGLMRESAVNAGRDPAAIKVQNH